MTVALGATSVVDGSVWNAVDYSGVSAQVAADVYGGIYRRSVADTTKAWVRQFDGPLQARWFGFADGASNNAARLESAMALLDANRGNEIELPFAQITMDRTVQVTRKSILRGKGMGTSTSYTDASATTLLIFPAGATGFRIKPTAQGTLIEEMRIVQASLLTTSQLGSYTAGGTTITLNAAGDFQNGQVVQLDGAGNDVIIYGRLFTTVSGSPVITWTDADGIFRGNAPGYIGMEISGTGIPAGATILSWGIGTMTISANATASNSGLNLTITTPIITEIVSGGGTTTLTIADIPNATKTVASRKISHAAPGIYSTIQCHTRNVEIFETQVGMCLHGITTGNNVADAGSFYSSYFRGSKFGVSLQGNDAQANSFYSCNFAGPEIGVLEQSALGNYFYGCHWAFNMGILVASQNAYTQVFGGYFETGTSYFARGGGTPSNALSFGALGLVPGFGWEGFAYYAGNFTSRALALLGPFSSKDDGTGLFYGGKIDGGFWASGARPAYFTGNSGGITGTVGTNSGVMLGNSGGGTGGINVIASVDNLSSFTLREAAILASQFRFGNSYLGSQFGIWTSSALDLGSGLVYRINGTQIAGPRQTGWTAATGTATRSAFATSTVTLATLAEHVKALIDDLTMHGLIGT